MGGSSVVEERGGMGFFFCQAFSKLPMPGVEEDTQEDMKGNYFTLFRTLQRHGLKTQ